MKKTKIFLLILSLAIIAFLVYSPHLIYKLPYHLDEWDHIGRSIRIQEQGVSYFFNNTPIEVGFDIILLILSIILSIVRIDIVNFYQFLPAINAIAIGLILFFYMKKKFNNYWLALSTLPFLAFLTSNVNILGIWFYVPIIATIPFIYLSLFNLESAVKSNSKTSLYLSALFLFIIAFIHQSSFLLLFVISLIYLLFNYKFVISNKKLFYPFAILIIPAIIMFFFLTNNLSNVSSFFSSFVWGPITPQIDYNPFTFYGILASIFLLIGFITAFRKKELLSFRIYSIFSLASILLFPLINFSLFSAYQRHIYHFMIASIPLSGLGLYMSLKFIYNKLSTISEKIRIVIIVVITILLLSGMSYDYFSLHPNAKLYHIIEPEEIPALQSLSQYPSGTVLTPIDMGIAVRPITKNHDEALNFFGWEKTKALEKFYSSNCDSKEEFLYNNYFTRAFDINEPEINPAVIKQTEKIDYILSESMLNCQFFKNLKKEGFLSSYSVSLNEDILVKINNPKKIDELPILIYGDKFDTKEFTFYSEITLNKEGENNSLIAKSAYGDGKTNGWRIKTDDKVIQVQWGNGTESFIMGSRKEFREGDTVKIAITYDSKVMNLYINGLLHGKKEAGLEYDKKANGLTRAFSIGQIWDFKSPGEINKLILINKSSTDIQIKNYGI